MKIVKLSCLALVAILALAVAQASAYAWEARIVSHPAMPSKFFAVDKASQTFFIYQCKSPLKVIGSYPCTTGRQPGDKAEEGDLRTPEGVYFIKGRLHRDLDWSLYGNLAYGLNFPNPVDRLNGKTGYGIWVHGRGKKLVPRDTRGCVALKVADLQAVGRSLPAGTPVVISSHVTVADDAADAGLMDQAVQRVHDWAASWQGRSDKFFSFYEPGAFEKLSKGSYADFVNHKRGLFTKLPWIQIMLHDVRVLPGPGYLVTYFKQYYRTPELVSEGVKRLYWEKDQDGELRIVGREWIQTRRSLDDEYLKRVTSEVGPVLEAWRQAWQKGDIKSYTAYYAQNAEQGDRHGVRAIQTQKTELWGQAPPAQVRFGADKKYDLDPRGVRVTFEQSYKAANGFTDHGEKELVLAPLDGSWKILSEDWRAL